jgi:very-short-patch-repair endonuclease
LKEDRDLRQKGWEIFRISNWDVDNRVNDILEELKEFIGF